MKRTIIFLLTAISLVVCACSNKGTSSSDTNEEIVVAPIEPVPMAIKGQGIFERKCAACHGNDGTAGIGKAANLQTSQSDTKVVANVIANGKGGMPAFKEQQTKEELTDLVHYVMTLRQ